MTATPVTTPARRPRLRRRRRLPTALAALVALLALYTAWTNTRPLTLSATVDIDATPEEVWHVLTDFSAYDDWNPFMVSAEGTAEPGAVLHLVMRDKTGDMAFDPTVRAAEPGRELRWLGRVGPGWIFDGEHRFLIEPLANGRVRLTQSERFTGVAVPFFQSMLHTATLPQFEAMNRALAARTAALRAP
ncbi:cyclase/dehydrase [Streptomyces laurentii]|uniref:Cyclase/dehydrase n=1 Tax=Streptomyces laurentii TaxID=39478 RepID=A0A160NXE1_STRLU|nr:cyclase/dehydrase [Streptomyces laurentii]